MALTLLPGTALAGNGFFQPVSPGFPWPFLLALAFAAAALIAPPRSSLPNRRLIATVIGLFLGALLLRLGFGVWAPLHINSQGPFWVGGATFLKFPRLYGPGYPQFFHPFTLLWPERPDLAVFAANGLVSSLLPVLLLGVGRSLGLNHWKSLAIALAAAVAPLFVRFSTSEGYFFLILLFASASLLAWLQVVPAFLNRNYVKTALFGLAGSLFAIQGLQTHPIAWPATAMALTVMLAHPAWKTWWHRILGLVAVGVVTGAVALLISGETLLVMLQHVARSEQDGGYGLGLVPRIRIQDEVATILLLGVIYDPVPPG